jgi:hypothetical protein
MIEISLSTLNTIIIVTLALIPITYYLGVSHGKDDATESCKKVLELVYMSTADAFLDEHSPIELKLFMHKVRSTIEKAGNTGH